MELNRYMEVIRIETINERVRKVRKELNLTLEKFGDKLGVQKSAVSRIENNVCGVTDQMIKSICREFKVDYIWLTTGEGEMFVDLDLNNFEIIQDIISNQSYFAQNVFKLCCKLSAEDWKNIEQIARNIKQYMAEIESENNKTSE